MLVQTSTVIHRPTPQWLRELLWRAARVTVPVGMMTMGCSPTVDACDPGVQSMASCTGKTIQVTMPLPAGALSDQQCAALCGHLYCQEQVLFSPKCFVMSVGTSAGAQSSVFCQGTCVVGRPPSDVIPPVFPMSTGAGVWARMAWFEAQSVVEFERLADDLERLGAAPSLIARARAAADDERRHAVVASRLAGRELPVLDPAVVFPRSLERVVFENFLGGCINESASAVKSASVGLALNDAALLGVASDEVGHAQLSWDLHHALHDGLSRDARNELATAGSALVERMNFADEGLSEDVRVETGQPSVARWREQLSVLSAELWAPALTALRS